MPASSRPKPCVCLKKPHESCPFAASCGPRRKKTDRSQISAFLQKLLGSCLLFSRTGVQPFPDSSTIELPSACTESGAYTLDRALSGSLRQWFLPCHHTSRRAPNRSSEGAHTWEHHPQPTIPPLHLNRQTKSRRQPIGCISRGRARPYTRQKDPPTLIPRNRAPERAGTRKFEWNGNITTLKTLDTLV